MLFYVKNDGGVRLGIIVMYEVNVLIDCSGYYFILVVWEIVDIGNVFY